MSRPDIITKTAWVIQAPDCMKCDHYMEPHLIPVDNGAGHEGDGEWVIAWTCCYDDCSSNRSADANA